MTAGLFADFEILFLEKFYKPFGCNLLEFGHQEEILAPDGIIT